MQKNYYFFLFVMPIKRSIKMQQAFNISFNYRLADLGKDKSLKTPGIFFFFFGTFIPSNRGIKNRNTASQETAVMDGSQSLSCFHGKSSTLCRAVLTDSCARLARLRVSFKERYFLPPPLLSSKHKMIADYMLALSGREINHRSARRGSFCASFCRARGTMRWLRR